MTRRLADSSLAFAQARRPGYDRARTRTGIVHLGLGAFSRAHLAVYLDDLLARGHDGHAVHGVSLRHDDVARALGPQDGLYTLAVVAGCDIDCRVIGAVRRISHAPGEREVVRAALAAPATTMVTITVTEKGYCWEPATRRLDLDHPDVRHDIATPTAPRSLPGHLVLAAADRRASGAGGLTVLSLDNLPSNGRTVAAVTLDLADATDPSLAPWIKEHVRFPCSMVDRLVPATDDDLRAKVAASTGVEDAWPVRAEPFSQWVVERDWATPMPPLDHVGVLVVDDVAPWELLKLRVLNGLHTTAALFGLAHGYDTVDEVVDAPAGRALLDCVAAEVIEVLAAPPGVDTPSYVATTLRRFANPALGHRCAQIAMDTSQKLPQRLLDTVRTRLDRRLPVDGLADVLALWAWSTLGRDDRGAPRPVQDPLASTFATITERSGRDADELVKALLDIESIFGDLAGRADLAALVAGRLAPLLTDTSGGTR